MVLALLLLRTVLPSAAPVGQRGTLALLFVFSLLLNWLLCSGGPGDLRLNLAPIWAHSELELRWGPAPIALFRLLGRILGGLHDTQIRWLNLVIGSLLPILVCAVVAELGVSRRAARWAGFLAAGHPWMIAFSGVLERQPLLLFAALASLLTLIAFLKRGGVDAFAGFVLATVLTVTSRPEGVQVLLVSLPIVSLIASSRRRRLSAGMAWLILMGLGSAYVRYALGYGAGLGPVAVIDANPSQLWWTLMLNPDFTPLAWVGVWTSGLVLGIRHRAAWVGIASLFSLHLAWSMTGLYEIIVGIERNVAPTRYQSIQLVPFAIGTGLFIDACLGAGRAMRTVIAVTVAAMTMATHGRSYDTLLRPFTVDHEYRFLRKVALSLPAQSHVCLMQSHVVDIGLMDAIEVPRFAGSEVTFDAWSPGGCRGTDASAGDSYLYIGSACAALIDPPQRPLPPEYARWLEQCASMRQEVKGSAVEEIDVPAHKIGFYDFQGSTVRLGIYQWP